MIRQRVVPGREATMRAATWVILVAVIVTILIGAIAALGFAPTAPGTDAWNYLGAGERLNAGHPLYQLTAGDRPIALAPPYWSVPLLAPPPIAVLWRPLALLGDSSMALWATLGLVTTLATVGWLVARGGLIVAAIVAGFAFALAEQSLAGNANNFLFLFLVLAWGARSRPIVVGGLIAIAIAVKLTPVLLVIWLIAERRWRATTATFVALGVIGVGSMLGAGLQNHLDWIRSLPNAAPAPTSVAGLTGLPASVVLVLAVALVVLVSRRGDDRLTFSAAVLAAALASPALYLGTLAIGAAMAAPWVPPRAELLPALRGFRA